MIHEAIILAGGLGTRLRGVIKDIPKPMAPVGGKPFLAYLIDRLGIHDVNHVILAVGYKHEVIHQFFGDNYHGIDISYAIEEEPLGTGGGIQLACERLRGSYGMVLNGDTLFDINFAEFGTQHLASGADLSIALRKVKDVDRYGKVVIEQDRIISFEEKRYIDEGYINGGIYALQKEYLKSHELPSKFSFEKDILERQVRRTDMRAYLSEAYFIDIGIPEDYERSQVEIPRLVP